MAPTTLMNSGSSSTSAPTLWAAKENCVSKFWKLSLISFERSIKIPFCKHLKWKNRPCSGFDSFLTCHSYCCETFCSQIFAGCLNWLAVLNVFTFPVDITLYITSLNRHTSTELVNMCCGSLAEIVQDLTKVIFSEEVLELFVTTVPSVHLDISIVSLVR